MPIEFACDCGKKFKVPDEYAGKRSKCTVCGKAVVVPTLTPAAVEESAEDAALRALTEGDDPEPAPRTTGGYAGGYSSGYAGAASNRPAAPPPPREDAGSYATRALASASTTTKVSKPKAKKARSSGYGYDEPPHRGWSPNWLKVGGGALGVLIGGGLLLGGLAAGRFFIWSPVIILVGIFGVINGLLSRSGDA